MINHLFEPLLSCICGESEYKLISLFDRNGLFLPSIICSNCHTIRYKNYIKSDQLNEFYSETYQRFYGRKNNLNVESRQKSSAKILLSSINTIKAKRICEIGCSQGHTVGTLQKFLECEAYGFDLDNSDILSASKQYPSTNYYRGDCFSKDLPDNIDLVYLIHVFEHLPSPHAFLEFIKSKMSANGALIIVVPDIFWAINNSKSFKLISYLHIAHPWNFSDAGMLSIAAKVGFTVDKLAKFMHNSRPAETWYILRKTSTAQAEKNYDHSYNCQKLSLTLIRIKFLASSILSLSFLKRLLYSTQPR